MRSRGLVATVLLALVAACAPAAGAAPVGQISYAGCSTGGPNGCATTGLPGISDVQDVAVSPDGRNVYATSFGSDSLTRFDRNPTTGALTRAGCITSAMGCGTSVDGRPGLTGAHGVAVSADGRSVYVAAETSKAVTAFARDPRTGALTYLGCVTQAASGCAVGANGKAGLESPQGVAVSPDGGTVIVVSRTSNAVAWLTRDRTTGAIAYDGCYSQGATCGGIFMGVGLAGATGVTVSPDSHSVYVTGYDSQAVAYFTRGPQPGDLAYRGCYTASSGCPNGGNGLASLTRPIDLVLDPTGRNLYVTSQVTNHALTVFDHDGPSGALTFRTCFDAGAICGGGRDADAQLLFADGVDVSADGRSLYVAGGYTYSLLRYDRDPRDGSLVRRDCFTQMTGCGTGRDGLGALMAPSKVAIAPDGRDLYVGTLGGKLLQFRRVPDTRPACAPPHAVGTEPGTSVRVVLRCADVNGDGFSVRFPSAPAHGALTRSADGGSVLYVPDHGYRGSDSFSVQAVDVFGAAGPTTQVSVTVAYSAPRLTKLKLDPTRFRAASRGGSIAAKRKRHAPPAGSRVSYQLDRAATVAFTVMRRAPGVRRHGRCVAPKRTRAGTAAARHCASTQTVGGFTRASRVGPSSFHFSGRINGHPLAPGNYTLTAVARGHGGTHSTRLTKRFSID